MSSPKVGDFHPPPEPWASKQRRFAALRTQLGVKIMGSDLKGRFNRKKWRIIFKNWTKQIIFSERWICLDLGPILKIEFLKKTIGF